MEINGSPAIPKTVADTLRRIESGQQRLDRDTGFQVVKELSDLGATSTEIADRLREVALKAPDASKLGRLAFDTYAQHSIRLVKEQQIINGERPTGLKALFSRAPPVAGYAPLEPADSYQVVEDWSIQRYLGNHRNEVALSKAYRAGSGGSRWSPHSDFHSGYRAVELAAGIQPNAYRGDNELLERMPPGSAGRLDSDDPWADFRAWLSSIYTLQKPRAGKRAWDHHQPDDVTESKH
jgi:hypothetical protein